MKYGYFNDAEREYVITRPDTPYPGINYRGSEDFFSLISNTSGGYCFYRDARTVSYTHLDVYKRQSWTSTPRTNVYCLTSFAAA